MQWEFFLFSLPWLFTMQAPVTCATPEGATCCWVSAKILAASFSIELKAFMLHYGSGNLDKIQTGRNPGLNFKALTVEARRESKKNSHSSQTTNQIVSEASSLIGPQQSSIASPPGSWRKFLYFFISPLFYDNY